MSARARVLMVDNHDSFVHTLVGYLTELGADVDLVEADEIDPEDAAAVLAGYDGVVISPGPGTPEQAGASIAVVRSAATERLPLLGVCLGHQAIAAAFGGAVTQAPELMHGMTSETTHDGSGLFEGVPSPFTVGRYHSLAAVEDRLPPSLRVVARSEGGTVMAVAHTSLPVHGVQFHPESVLTENGYLLLGNWLASLGLAGAAELGARLSPHRGRISPSTPSV